MGLRAGVTSRQSSYIQNRIWSDPLLSKARAAVGFELLCIAPLDYDLRLAADLITVRNHPHCIGVRLREFGYMERYGDEFTSRSGVPSGCKTEFQKILDGYMDWMFYGFADQTKGDIAAYTILDMDAFRFHWANNRDQIEYVEDQRNFDGTRFNAFTVSSFPPDPPLVIKRCRRAQF